MSRKSFTSEFKQECVELVIRQGYQVKQAAIAMDVDLSTLQRYSLRDGWIALHYPK